MRLPCWFVTQNTHIPLLPHPSSHLPSPPPSPLLSPSFTSFLTSPLTFLHLLPHPSSHLPSPPSLFFSPPYLLYFPKVNRKSTESQPKTKRKSDENRTKVNRKSYHLSLCSCHTYYQPSHLPPPPDSSLRVLRIKAHDELKITVPKWYFFNGLKLVKFL